VHYYDAPTTTTVVAPQPPPSKAAKTESSSSCSGEYVGGLCVEDAKEARALQASYDVRNALEASSASSSPSSSSTPSSSFATADVYTPPNPARLVDDNVLLAAERRREGHDAHGYHRHS
jgi:hypothetical protein